MKYVIIIFLQIIFIFGSISGHDSVELNGFILDEPLVPVNEILKGGQPKDGIQSIDNPVFIAPEEAIISENAYVLGVSHNGISKAYPIYILNYHEVVNDEFGGDHIAVTYCPLCGSGVSFLSEMEGEKFEFGVSGLLYNSDVLLYDRKTESLWSQIKAKAISGEHKGQELETINTQHTTWNAWKAQNPNTLLLSEQTGKYKKYGRNPYSGYDETNDLLFPVSYTDERLGNKERVLGIKLDGKAKAYPFKELMKAGGRVEDELAGNEIYIDFDLKTQIVHVYDSNGQILPAFTMYWFAWAAFHPGSELYMHK